MGGNGPVPRRRYLGLASAWLGVLAGCLGGTTSNPQGTQDGSTERADTAGAGATAVPNADNPSESSGTATTQNAAIQTGTNTPSGTGSTSPTATAGRSTSGEAIRSAERSIASVSFEGSWFDTHAHWRMADVFRYDDYETKTLTARQREHDVGATVLFVPHEPFQREYGTTVNTLASEHVDYLPFLFPGGFASAEQRRSYYAEHDDVYHGLGEVTFYAGSEQGKALTDAPFPQYFQLSEYEDLVLMVHPTKKQAGDIGPMLREYPEATLLLHGHELLGTFETLHSLMAEHDNLYWTYDTATMLGGLMVRARGKEDFLEQYEANRDRYRKRVMDRLPKLLEAAPERVMWGTDIVADWHLDPDVYGELIAFSEDIRSSLPEKHRDPFAYENAVRLFDG